MKHLLPLLLLFLFSLKLSSQVPGFLGKRVFLEMQLSPSLNYGVQRNVGYASGYKPFSFNTRVGLNFVTGRHSYLALEVDQKSAINEIRDLSRLSQREMIFRSTIRTYGLGYYKMFARPIGTSKALSPLGKFIGYRIYAGQFTAGPESEADLARYESRYNVFEFDYVGAAMVVGSRTIFKDRILLSAALEIGTGFLTDQTRINFDEEISDSTRRLSNYTTSYVGINIGLGYLLF